MSRNTGTFNFAANFEVLAKAPLDAKQLVGTKADLINPAIWSGSTGVWLYDGAIVSVASDPIPENNGIYFLASASTYTDINSWIKAGTGEGGGTITGGTNGLSQSGANITLGGDLLSGTTINGQGVHSLQLTDVDGLIVSTTGGTDFIADNIGFSLSFSGGSVTFDDDGGLKYGGDYSGGFTSESIPDVAYVTGLTGTYLKLDQTTPQDVCYGQPYFHEGLILHEFPLPSLVTGHTVGKMFYDPFYETITAQIGHPDTCGNAVNLQLGQEMHRLVWNETGVEILNGDVVRTVSTHCGGGICADTPAVCLAKADSMICGNVIGVATQVISASTYGFITTVGYVSDIDTTSGKYSGFTTGDIIYLSPTIDGGVTNTPPASPNIQYRLGRLTTTGTTAKLNVDLELVYRLDDLADVNASTPSLDDVLKWNGLDWVNGVVGSASASAGINFYYATPIINAVSSPAGISNAGVGNGIQVATFSKIPVTTGGTIVLAALSASDTQAFAAWGRETPIERTTIDAGLWEFYDYISVDTVVGTTYLIHGMYQIVDVTGSTITTTGAGTTRTATITSGEFTGNYYNPDAINTNASFLQTPSGVFQISASASTNSVTIVTPSAYVNESGVSGNTWNKLFTGSTESIENTTPLYQTKIVAPAFSVSTTDKLGEILFVSASGAYTLSFSYNGTSAASFVISPLITLHNDLAGLQGGTGSERFHSTCAENQLLTGINDYGVTAKEVCALAGVPVTLTGTELGYVDGVTSSIQTQLNSKLPTSIFTSYTANTLSIFTGYTASTETRIQGIENDITYLSGVTDTKLNINTFTGYTASTSILINSKLDTTLFNTYTGTTQPIIDIALTGATNGLSTSGRDIKLGGVLSEQTVVSGASFNLCFGDVGSSLNVFAVNATDINLQSGSYLISDSNSTGVKYAGDYSANYTCLSIPNAGWVTGYTNCAISNFTNERIVKQITKSSHGFVLNDVIGWSGGTYNKAIADDTYNGEIIGLVSEVVDGNTFDLTQAGYVSGLTGLTINTTYFLSDSVAGKLTATAPTTEGYLNKAVIIANSSTTGWVLPYNGFLVSSGFSETLTGVTNGLHIIDKNAALGGVLTGDTVFDGTASKYHLQYGGDYCTNFTARSIPDAAWVTGKTQANNGLSRTGDYIGLGGVMSVNTTISGATRDLFFGNTASQFNIVCVNAQNTFETCAPYTRICAVDELRLAGLSGSQSITMQSGQDGIIVNDSTNSRGLIYNSTYKANFLCHSLVDVDYVTGLTTTSGIQTANNGLNKAGTNVRLGGALTGNTNITGAFALGLCTTTVNINPTGAVTLNAGSTVGICPTGAINIQGSAINANTVVNYNNEKVYTALSLPSAGWVTGKTSQAILTASNGLTEVGQDVRLGGTLTQNTDICLGGATPYGLYIRNSGATNCTAAVFTSTAISLCGANPSSPNQIGRLTAAYTGTVMCNGFASCYSSINMVNSLMGITICGGASSASFTVTDATTTPRGIEYAACYHDTYIARSLVDAEYVTGLTSQAILTASNGLTKTGTNVTLGGNLIQNTTVDGQSTYFFRACNLTTGILSTSVYNYLCVGTGSATMLADTGATTLNIQRGQGLSRQLIQFSDTCMIVADVLGSKGLVYDADYSSNFTARSIPDAEYVTGLTSQAILTASNGLTKSGTDVVLGGLLTQATTINLSGNTFKLQSNAGNCGVADFSLSPTYANSKFGICSNGGSGAIWGLSGNSTSISAQHCSSSSNGGSFIVGDTGLTLTNKCSSVSKVVKLTDKALIYGDCYHSCYVDRTLIDKEYLDIQMCETSNVINVVNPPVGTVYNVGRYDDLIPVSGISSNEIYLNYSALCGYPVLGQRVTVVDVCGNALADPIIINGNGKLINDGVCSVINTDYGSVTYVYNGYFWSAIAFVN